MDLCFQISLFVTCAMFGVIWMVQLVHYPMFEGLSAQTFMKWHQFHSNRITFIVAPLMIAELVSAVFLAWDKQDQTSILLCALTIGVWISTFAFSVPIHHQLGQSSPQTALLIRKLVLTNCIRTGLYTFKVIALFFILSFGSF